MEITDTPSAPNVANTTAMVPSSKCPIATVLSGQHDGIQEEPFIEVRKV